MPGEPDRVTVPELERRIDHVVACAERVVKRIKGEPVEQGVPAL